VPWVVIALFVFALGLPVLLAVVLNKRQPRPARGENDNADDPRFAGMNKQGLGWGTRDNNRGGLQ